MLKHLRDPVYVCRPEQIFTRVWYAFRGLQDRETAELAWGGQLTVLGTEKNGRTILHRGAKELAVTEACFRLSRIGTVGVDVGANVGHMTSALAHAMKAGRVHAFEPHPEIFPLLQENASRLARETPKVSLTVREAAVGRTTQHQTLHVPEQWSQNRGLASLCERAEAEAVEVEACRLDEEYEPAVLEGARTLLSNQRIHHVLFEDHDIENSAAVQRLRETGYTIFAVRKRLLGPKLIPLRQSDGYNFVATVRPKECISSFEPNGWYSLRNQ